MTEDDSLLYATVFDIEANGLEATRMHCVAQGRYRGKVKSTDDEGKAKRFFTNAKVLVGHNIQRYDIPTVERLLGVKVKARLIDTLALSWILYPNRTKHGLEAWGEDLGHPKPPVYDWENEDISVYLHRCEEDVQINTKLWKKMYTYLMKLYGTEEAVMAYLDYIEFKMDCAKEQERSRWKLDVDKATELREQLWNKFVELKDKVSEVMPEGVKYTERKRPKRYFNQNGGKTAWGEQWEALLEEHGLPLDTEVVKVESSRAPGNPASDPQLKSWLFSLGWNPCTFKYVRDKATGDVRTIPQVRKKNDDNEPILTSSVKLLVEKEPNLAYLRDMGVVKHRYDVVNGFLNAVSEDGWVKAEVGGITNTLRFKHRVCVNLPGIDKPYGTDLRGLLIAPEGYELCGSDQSSLEDRTKQHFMYPYDPEYVKEMCTPDFDPHLDLALFAKAISKEQSDGYKQGVPELKKLVKPIRSAYKSANYACTYGAGGPTVARTAGVKEREGYKLVEAYWKRNWALEKIAAACKVKTVNGQNGY